MDSMASEISGIKLIQLRLRQEVDLLDERILRAERKLRIEKQPPPQAYAASERPKPPTHPVDPLPPAAPPPPPKATVNTPPAAPAESFELRFGRVWLVRIGIVVLLTGLVLLGNFAYHEFIARIGPAGKIALLYATAAFLAVIGWRLQKRETFHGYGRVLSGGGLAVVYYTTYAAHFVTNLRIIDSPVIAGFLLMVLAGLFVWLADRTKSSVLAGATIALTFYTAAINPIGAFSLFSNLVVSAAAVILLARQRWTKVSFLTLVGTYAALLFWRMQHGGAPFLEAEDFLPGLLFPASYWLVHTCAVLWRRTPTFDPAARVVYLTINNAAFFALAAPVVEIHQPGTLCIWTLAYGALLLSFGFLAGRRTPQEPWFDGGYLVQGLGLVFSSLVFKLSGPSLPFAFALMSGTLIAISRLRHGGIFRFFAAIAALVATAGAIAQVGFGKPHASLVAGACSIILTANAWLLRVRKGLSRNSSVDFEVAGFVGLATFLTFLACTSDHSLHAGLRLLGIGVAATLSLRLIRLPELIYAGQILILAGQSHYLATASLESAPSPIFPAIAGGIASVWWQRRTLLAAIPARAWQTVHLLIPVLLTLWWVHLNISTDWQPVAFAGIGLAVTIAGFLARIWPLSAAAAVFDIAALVAFTHGISHTSEWLPLVVTAVTLHLQSLAVGALGHRAPVKSSGLLLSACRILRILVSGCATLLVFAHVSASLWLTVFTTGAAALLAWTAFARNKESATHAAVFAGMGIAAWFATALSRAPHPADYIPFALMLIAGRCIASSKRLSWLPAKASPALAVAGLGGLWILSHRLLTANFEGRVTTIGWSLLAFATLGAGFALRDRTYRLAGLVMLVAAVLRVFAVDVMAMETIFRILSFLVLGVVLLVLSFLYNRHAAAIRKWL